MKAAAFALTLAAGLALPAAAQSNPSSRTDAIEALPDPAGLPAAEVPYVHPLYRPVDTPAALTGPRPTFPELEVPAVLAVTVHVDPTGRVLEAFAVEPPLKALSASLPALVPKWKYAPATKGGSPVATWATLALELFVDLDKGTWGSLAVSPIGKDDPLVPPVKETSGETWMSRYPREISPKDPTAISIEDVDAAPNPTKTSWDLDDARHRSRVNALIEVSSAGTVKRLVAIGDQNEPLIVAWVRRTIPTWKLTPAMAGGKSVDSWLVLDGTIDYSLVSAKLKNRRPVRKNLRGVPGG